MVAAIDRLIADQALDRGEWADPRFADQPDPPWPSHDSPALEFLLARARVQLTQGMEVEEVMIHLAVHAWFEGGIENYDRGQRDARRPRLI